MVRTSFSANEIKQIDKYYDQWPKQCCNTPDKAEYVRGKAQANHLSLALR